MSQSDSLLTEIQSNEPRIGEQRATISGNGGGGQASLRILEAATEFEEFREVWSAWSDGPEADLDFFSIHLRHRPEAVRPHVMVVNRDGRPDCMLVGWLEQGAVIFKAGPLDLFRPNARILRFVSGGFLGNQSRENSRFLLCGSIRSMHEQQAQAVEFSQLRVDSPLYDLAKREPNLFCRDYFTPVQTRRYLTLPANFDEFLRGHSRKSRHEFRTNARVLERDFPGRVRFQCVGSELDVAEFARRADEISQKTYQRATGVGFVDNLEMREMLCAAVQKSALRACLLYIGDRPVAFASGIVSNNTLYGTFMGYDPGFNKYRPGLQTLMCLIEDSFEPRGSLLRVDAGSGDLPYKFRLFDSSWKEAPVWIFASSATGLKLHVLKMVSTMLHYSTMRLLEKCDQLRKVRKMWHRQAPRKFQLGNF